MSQPARRARKSKGEPATPRIPATTTSPSASSSSKSPPQKSVPIPAQQKTKTGATKRKRNNDDDEPPAQQPPAKQQRRSKVVSCQGCRRRKSKCDHSRPGCTQCRIVGIECVYQADAQAAPMGKGQGPDALPNLTSRMRSLMHDIEALAASGVLIPRDETLQKSGSFAFDPDGYFTGPSSIASYSSPIASSSSSSSSLPFDLAMSPASNHAQLSPFGAQIMPAMNLRVEHSELLDMQTLAKLVHWYKIEVIKEFRLATPEALEVEINLGVDSAYLMMACAVSRLHVPSSENAEQAAQYYTWAQDSLRKRQNQSYLPTIKDVELLLLQAQYLFTTRGDVEKIYSVIGHCVRLAVSLGMHREPRPKQAFDKQMLERRRWALHNVVLLDRWISFVTGRPVALRNRDFDAAYPAVGEGEGPDAQKFRFHNELFKLAALLGDILAESSSIYVASYDSALAFDKRITDFLAALPPSLVRARGTFEGVAIHSLALHMRAMLHKPYIHLDESEAMGEQENDAGVPLQDAIGAACDAATDLVATAHEVVLGGRLLEGRLPWLPYHVDVAAQLIATHNGAKASGPLSVALAALKWFEHSDHAALVHERVAKLLDMHPSPESMGFASLSPLGGMQMPWPQFVPYDPAAVGAANALLWTPQPQQMLYHSGPVQPDTVDPSLLMQVV